MRHHKEVWKLKFNLIFPLRPGLGREGLSYRNFKSFFQSFSCGRLNRLIFPLSTEDDCTTLFPLKQKLIYWNYTPHFNERRTRLSKLVLNTTEFSTCKTLEKVWHFFKNNILDSKHRRKTFFFFKKQKIIVGRACRPTNLFGLA